MLVSMTAVEKSPNYKEIGRDKTELEYNEDKTEYLEFKI